MKYSVKSPILGFEFIKEVELKKIDDIFSRLEDTGDSGISFTLINPFALREYTFDIPTDFQEKLDIKQDSTLLVYNIIVIQTPIEQSKINFLAPLVFNKSNNTMGQVILDNTTYPNFYIVEELSMYLSSK